MNNRMKRLYIVVPLLWIVLIGAATWMAYVRSPKGPVVEEGEKKALAPTSGTGRCVAAGIEMPAWGMSVPPARGKGGVPPTWCGRVASGTGAVGPTSVRSHCEKRVRYTCWLPCPARLEAGL